MNKAGTVLLITLHSCHKVALPQQLLPPALFTLKLSLCPCKGIECEGTCLSLTLIWPGSNYRT